MAALRAQDATRPGALAAARATDRWAGATARLALLGATVGVGLDAIHTHTGTTVYTHPLFLRAAWWVPPLFAGAAMAMGLSRPLAERLLGWRRRRPPAGQVAAGMGLFVLAYALSGLLSGPSSIRVAVLGAVFGLAWAACDRSALGLVLAAGTALAGTMVEASLVASGAFAYLAPDVGGVPLWLPVLYLTGALGVGGLGLRLVIPAS